MSIQLSSRKRRQSHSESLALEEPSAKRHAGFRLFRTFQLGTSQPETMVPKKTITDLPPEIIEMVFEMVFPPYSLRARPRGYECGPTNYGWRKTLAGKMAIMSVCRAWSLSGRPFLYRDITILSRRGLDALWWTFHHNHDLGRLVRSLSFVFSAVPATIFSEDRSCRDMADILTLCLLVKRLDFLPDAGGYSLTEPLPIIPSTITSLTLGSHIGFAQMRFALMPQTCDRLQELCITLEDHPSKDFIESPMSFARLHTLQLTCRGRCEDCVPNILTAAWDMPQLKRVIFRRPESLLWDGDPFPEYTCFLERHGLRLEYLEFPDCGPPEGQDFGSLLILCPVLQHLVLPASARIGEEYKFPTVRWLDVWCTREDDAVDPTPWPNVDTIRRLDPQLLKVILDLPRACDPRSRWEQQLVWPGLALLKVERDGISHLLQPDEAEKGRMSIDWNEDADDGEAVDVETLPDPWDEYNSSRSGESSDTECDVLEEEPTEPEPVLRPGLRRLLQVTMPKRVFARLERVLLDLVVPSVR
ncbi:hypothetical protein B0H16DRAFT_263548 [Mycena metata]|uniref:F-box domain-containing protein n=1 Tax=Mycena metata TaxID=1033252 RepID=A0AAD7HTE1_9AGAR|nr:hypothetical protein B0H16DRAFT_263548 [Mycena metata]